MTMIMMKSCWRACWLAFALSSVGVQFVADVALALEAAESVDALVVTAVRVRRTLVELCNQQHTGLTTHGRMSWWGEGCSPQE